MAETSDRPVIVPHQSALSPPRPGVRHVPVVGVGVIVADDELRDRVSRVFHWPMICLAIAVLPLLVIEFFMAPTGALAWAVKIGFAIIWIAFVVEFIVKLTLAERRIEYVRRNWLDLVIILVPVTRPLRAAAVVRTARVFKMRGVAMKFITVVIGLEATDRWLERLGVKSRDQRNPKQMTRYELIDEVKRLRSVRDAWEAWYEEHERHVDQHGGPCLLADKPGDEPPVSAPAEAPEPT